MISISLNDQEVKVAANSSLLDVLAKQGYVNNGFAVAVNRQFVPRGSHHQTILKAGDVVEIITPMQGG